MFNNKDIQKTLNIDLPISPTMSEAMSSWINEFRAKTKSDKKKISTPLNMSYLVSKYLANLINLELDCSVGDGRRAKYIMGILDRFKNEDLNAAAQHAIALSHCIFKPYISRGKIIVELIKCDKFIPIAFENKRLTSVIFIDEAKSGDKYYRRLEWHKYNDNGMYVIENKVFKSDNPDMLGDEIPITLTQWANLSPHVEIANVDNMLFGYFRMPFANNVDIDSPLPISIFANSMITLREIENQYNNYIHEFSSGRRKRYIDRDALAKDIEGNYKDIDDDFIMLQATNPQTQGFFNDYTPTIREVEIRQGLETQLRILETQLQISQGTFSINPITGAVTATQVVSTDKTTFHTIGSLQSAEKQAVEDLVYAMDVYCSLYNLAPTEKIELAISFGDSVFEDTGTALAHMITLKSNGVLSAAEVRAWWTGENLEQATKNLPKSEYEPSVDDTE